MRTSIIRKLQLLKRSYGNLKPLSKAITQRATVPNPYHVSQDTNGLIYSQTGEVWPWYTFPAIEYLSELDFSKDVIFEYGCGSSTIFWAQRARKVVSIEHDAAWASKIAKVAPSNVEIFVLPPATDYAAALLASGGNFDVIVIDGIYRAKCCRDVGQALNPGGLVILDNSDWYTTASRIIRDQNLIQVDISGWGPLNNYTWTTSLFFHRLFTKTTRDNKQPHYSRCALQHPDTLE